VRAMRLPLIFAAAGLVLLLVAHALKPDPAPDPRGGRAETDATVSPKAPAGDEETLRGREGDAAAPVPAAGEEIEDLAQDELWWLDVRVSDAETGREPIDRVEVAVRDLETGEVLRRDEPLALRSRVREEGLPPGRYGITVAAPGYVPSPEQEVRLDASGGETRVEVSLDLDVSAGRVLLTFPLPEDARLIHVEDLWLDAPTEEDGRWRPRRPRSVDEEAGVVEVAPLPLGKHRLFVWAGPRKVGEVFVDVRGGPGDRATVEVGPGLRVEFFESPFFEEDDPDDPLMIAVDVLDGEGVEMPPVRWERQQRSGIGLGGGGLPEDRVERSGPVTRDTVLGPYPVDALEIRRVGAEGAEPWQVRAE
jgi:hypothetical protein